MLIRSLLQWIREGYPSRITDTADDAAMGGPSKIDSVQNLITLRSDLHEAWVNYDFGVDPGVGLIVKHKLSQVSDSLHRTITESPRLQTAAQMSMADILNWTISKIVPLGHSTNCSSTISNNVFSST